MVSIPDNIREVLYRFNWDKLLVDVRRTNYFTDRGKKEVRNGGPSRHEWAGDTGGSAAGVDVWRSGYLTDRGKKEVRNKGLSRLCVHEVVAKGREAHKRLQGLRQE